MFDFSEELKKLPDKPGVYIMHSDTDEIIYVGKAINLKNRVRQYFQNSKNKSPKVAAMVSHIAYFEYIVTASEMEALLLECNLIKEHRPKYNVMLKDDKTYPYIKVTIAEEYPRIFITRKYVKDKNRYFGPITDVTAARETVDIIHKLFPIRKCRKSLPKEIGRERPCLNHHIGQCLAPCDSLVSAEEYRKVVDEAIAVLEGKYDYIIKYLEGIMYAASDELDFEKAAATRDKINGIKKIMEKQRISNTGIGDSDVIAFSRAMDEALVQVFFIRGGKLSGREHFLINAPDYIDRSGIMTEFVKQFYSGTAYIPKELILEEPLLEEEEPVIEELLENMRGSKVIITVPQKGEKHKMVQLAAQNAAITFERIGERIKKEQRETIGALEEIKNALGIERIPYRIESYDISNTQGFESVGSMVVFENGRAKNSDYRKFKIKTVIGANDFASMEEVITRRLMHSMKEEKLGSSFARLPDMIFVDGGKTQITAAQNAMQNVGIYIPVCGMVKDDRHRTRGLLYNGEEIELPTNSEGFKLITRIQDEVHRFAIEYHRKLRNEKQVHSILDDIEGIGPKRRRMLMQHFGDIEKIRNAEVDELLEIPEMTIKAAENVYAFFHMQNNDKES
ncbi:excinuclease ABC subunit UvrC [Anaerotignum sp. MSJ-24]|uniref:excinuclease ABC subunit UvrC n=1 Tax=Anaerotignum sp. MSJ-24 TaxID=2841521 RepID=UPI001C0FC658|nr:excinuclease ABC subunit UvrC [Anaerotignum sp. MSJ-24]MBU5463574.1 excinuclease ABC subunit UvrC [Anaerotignum sp. MSJ-24]